MPPLPGPILRAGCNSRSLECRPGQKTVPGRSQPFPLQGILSSCHHHAFPRPVTRWVPRRSRRPAGNMPVQFPIRNTIRCRSAPFSKGAADAAIVSSVPPKVKDSLVAFSRLTAQHFPGAFGKIPQKSPPDRGAPLHAPARRPVSLSSPGSAGRAAGQSPSGPWRSGGGGIWGSGPPGAPGPGCPRL